MNNEEYFDESGHLTDFALHELIYGEPSELRRLELAEHLSFCDACTERYTQLLCAAPLSAPPAPLAPGVLATIRKRARTVFFNRYCAAGFAACLALGLWVTAWSSGMFSPDALRREPASASGYSQFQREFAQRASSLEHDVMDSFNNFFDRFTWKGDQNHA